MITPTRTHDLLDSYFAEARRQLDQVYLTQRAALEQSGQWLGAALAADRWLYAFGTGHSHALAEEIFYRAGGLAHACPMLDEATMLHENAIDATHLERRTGHAAAVLERYPIAAGDILLVASNSGRNSVPVEMALEGRARGLRVIAITNLAHSRAWPSRHASGKRLFEVADLAIDNCGVPGDACLDVPGMPSKIGPTSTITGAFIVNAIIARGIEVALSQSVAPEIYISSNTNGDSHNNWLLEKYRARVRHL